MLKVLYAGSPESAATVLRGLLNDASADDCYKIVGVLTNPPSTQGRHKTLVPTPVALAADECGISTFAPQHLDSAARDDIAPLGADILVCFAYGHTFGPKFLALFPMGGVNLHPSLLPKYRGATPVPAAILNRDSETAVTVQRLALGMDTGEILAQERIALDGTETAGELLEYAAQRGAGLLKALLQEAAARHALPQGSTQAGEASYTKTITKEDAHIDWTQSADEIDAHIRAYTPAPGAWTMYKGQMLRILKAHPIARTTERRDTKANAVAVDNASPSARQCSQNAAAVGTVAGYKKGEGIIVQTGRGEIAITMLQKQGKKAMDADSFVNGERGIPGTVLGVQGAT